MFCENKWLLIFLISSILIFIIYQYSDTYQNNIENLESITADPISNTTVNTVRKLDDYVTEMVSEADKKIINLKCKIGEIDYYLGNIDIEKINKKCNLCENSKIANNMLVLCDSNYKAIENCEKKMAHKCFNDQTIINCNDFIEKQCNKNKINNNSFNFELQAINLKSGEFVLLSNKKHENIKKSLVSLLDTKNKDKNLTDLLKDVVLFDMPIIKQKYIVCCDEENIVLTEKQKIYLDLEDLPKDKIRFKFYFMDTKGNKKYIGYNSDKLCYDDEKVKNKFKSLTVYDNKDDIKVLIFEPEIINIISKLK